MVRAGLGALLSHWWRHPAQLAMLLLGLSLATALWSGVQAINAEARASYERAAATLGQDRLSRVVAADGALLPQASYVALRRAGWLVSPVLEGSLEPSGVRLLGIDPLTLPREAATAEIGAAGILRPFLSSGGLLLVNAETAARLAGADLPPLQVDATLPPGLALADIGVAQRLLGGNGQLSYLILAPGAQPSVPLDAVVPGLALRAPDGGGDLARLTDSFHLNLTAFGFLAFAVGLFIVHSAIGLAFEQRRPVFRTLRALGVSAGALTGLLLAELLALALVAGLAGVAMGYLVAAALLPDVAATLRGLYGAEVPGTLGLRPGWWGAGLGIAVAGTLLAAAQSLWRIAHLPLLAPAQPRAWARATARSLRWQALAGAALLVGALSQALIGSGLWAGFAVLAGLLLGSALLLPAALQGVARAGARLSRGVLAQWFWADTRQQLPGLSLALMALLLALAANIGVGTMVSSFRQTFTGWLDQRLVSELYVTARDDAEAARMLDWLRPRVDAILPIWSVEAPILGQTGEIYGVADHDTYRKNWPMLRGTPDAWDAVAAGRGVLVNEQLFRRERLELGGLLDLPGGGPLAIVGVYSDYGNPKPQVLVSVEELTARFPDVSRLRYGLRVAPEKAQGLAAELRAALDLAPRAVIDQAGIKRFSLEVFERTFAVTAALNVLTLGVAGLALFASLLTLSGMRLPQLAPVWAMGLTRRHLARLDLARTLLLALLTLVAALPLGLALAWVLLAVVNVEAFGWRLPMLLFPSDWLRLGALALVAAGAAAAIPARRLARLSPTELLKVFTNER